MTRWRCLPLCSLLLLAVLAGCNRGPSKDELAGQLMKAAGSGDLKQVQALLTQEAPVDTTDQEGRTALHTALAGGHSDVAIALINAGAPPNKTDGAGNTPLHLAAQAGDTATVKALLDNKADVAAQDPEGVTPLHAAAFAGEHTAAALLQKAGAKADLYTAAALGDEALAAKLISTSKDLDAPGPGKATVLYRAVAGGHTALVAQLIQAGATPTAEALAALGDTEKLKALFKQGTDVNATDVRGRTLLHTAAELGNLAMVKLLLASKANPDLTDKEGHTPLHLAVMANQAEATKMLVEAGAKQTKTKDGQTPKKMAASRQALAVVDALSPSAVIDRTISDSNPVNLPLAAAARAGDPVQVGAHLKKGVAPNEPDDLGVTPLEWAAHGDYQPVVALLLEAGADPSAVTATGSTAMHAAVRAGNKNIVGFLLGHSMENNLSIAVEDKHHETPLHTAIRTGHDAVAFLLIQGGVDIIAMNDEGTAPLHAAATHGRTKVVKYLLSMLGNQQSPDGRGHTPAELAARAGHRELAALLANPDLEKINEELQTPLKPQGQEN